MYTAKHGLYRMCNAVGPTETYQQLVTHSRAELPTVRYSKLQTTFHKQHEIVEQEQLATLTRMSKL